ncbi:MAG TPA: hypothetical protein VL346_12555 [Acidobacteriaceae bacterium]|nr:hypothetical protein [Acidobacteriaceae bacterium]
MLSDEEFAEVSSLYREGIRAGKEFRLANGIPLENATIEVRFRNLLAAYERLTGYRETNPNAVMHHRLSLYGPPCRHCGKPLRTPQTKLCGACMTPVV